MARRVFFSFHFERDIWRANQVRNCNVIPGPEVAGFFDHSEYEEAKRKGEPEIQRLIRAKLGGTSVTVVLIGQETATRPYVQYEIERSIAQKNGLLGIHIHNLKNRDQQTSLRGPKPSVPYGVEFPSYDWDGDLPRFAREIEAAGKRSDALRR
jgi:antiphage defense system Thoeris ThsB-like protein